MKDFTEEPKEEIWGNQVLGLGGALEASYLFYYSPRGRDSSYFGFISIIWADFRRNVV